MKTGEIKALTGFRALAAFIVFLCHYAPNGDAFPYAWTARYGARGVDFFFVLSGFLFTILYFRKFNTKSQDYKEYFVKRITRIYPVYWFLLAVMIVLEAYDVSRLYPEFNWNTFLLNTFLLQGLFPSHAYIIQAWTLTVEEIFYACVPLIMIFIGKFCMTSREEDGTKISMLKVALFLSVICAVETLLFKRFANFALGILAGCFVLNYPASKILNSKIWGNIIGVLSAVTFILTVLINGVPHSEGWDAESAALVLTICFGVSATLFLLSLYGESIFRTIFENKYIVYGGKISFAFYLVHYRILDIKEPLYIVVSRWTGHDPHWMPAMLSVMFIVFLITVGASIILYEGLENPVQKYLRMKMLTPKVASQNTATA